MNKFFTQILAKIILISLSISLLSPLCAQAVLADPNDYPKLANHFLDWDLTEAKVQELSKWNVVTVSAAAYTQHPELVKKLKVLNPKMTLFVYVVSNETANWALKLEDGNLWKDTYNKVQQSGWWLTGPQGQHVSTWPGADWINLSSTCPTVNGEQFSDWLAKTTVNRFLKDELFDGVFYDNVFTTIDWTNTPIDINNDGNADTSDYVNQRWQEGVHHLLSATRNLAPNKIIIANAKDNFYNSSLNGKYREHFPADYMHGWKDEMQRYLNPNLGFDPKLYIINSNNNNIKDQLYDLRKVRFTFASTLLGNGYFQYSAGDQGYDSNWWYDEYDVHMGKPLSDAKNLSTPGIIGRGVWSREFENGFVFVNTKEARDSVPLNADLEKIKGTQDPIFNNGAIIRKIYLNPDEGIILQKRIAKIYDTQFTNGSFVRPFNSSGLTLERNGFFLFNNKFAGSQSLEEIDLDGDGEREIIASDKYKLIIYKANLTPLSVIYPFGDKYFAGMSFSAGDLDADGRSEIVIGSGKGVPAQVKVFSIEGKEIRSFAPYSKWNKNGLNVSVAELNGKPGKEIALVQATAGTPEIRIFGRDGKLVGVFRAYDNSFLKGLNITAADINNDGTDELITGTGYGSAPLIKIFSAKGKTINKGFYAADIKNRKGVTVSAADIENDGHIEILGSVPTF